MNQQNGGDVEILAQPNDVTCGPTCLQAVYSYYGVQIDLSQVIKEVSQLQGGGTLGVMLGTHALKMGFDVKIYTYNLPMFDPTWFLDKTNLNQKLEEQLIYKKSKKFALATSYYQKFLSLGGKILQEELSPGLIRKYLSKKQPILTGLSATYLYQSRREIPELNVYHDVKGEPAGHFVVLSGYDKDRRTVWVADPLKPNPIMNTEQHYEVPMQRLINSILLGIVTYDANLLVIQPGRK